MEPYHVRASHSCAAWLVGGLDVEKKILSAKSWCYSMQFIVWGRAKEEIYQSQPRTVHELEQNSRYFTIGFSRRLKGKCWVESCHVAAARPKCWGGAWDLKWCKICSNVQQDTNIEMYVVTLLPRSILRVQSQITLYWQTLLRYCQEISRSVGSYQNQQAEDILSHNTRSV